MGVLQIGVPVTEGALYKGAVSANATSYAGRVGAIPMISWDDTESEVDGDVVVEEDAEEPVKRGPGRPKKVS